MEAIWDLPLDGRGAAYAQIYRALRAAVQSGRAAAGTRLPSTRWLASDLGVSRNTVLAAYEQLLAEGYAVSRVGSGTYVAPSLPDQIELPSRARPRPSAARPARPRLSRYGRRLAESDARRVYDEIAERGEVAVDFMPCVPAVRARANEAWRRCVTRRLAVSPAPLDGYGDPAGIPALREQIAKHITRTRGVSCEADDVLVVSGLAQALDLAARLLLDEGDRVLIEDPHYIGARRAFHAVGAQLVPVPVDAEGLCIQAGAPEVADCRLAYVTPSHQFPSGAVLSLARRMQLLEWAERSDAFLIEDDYDSEFRYAGQAIESLKSLDARGRVLYVGTFSKVLDPALRIAYLVVPSSLRKLFRDARWQADWASPALEQEALALFLESGEFERHLRRMRTLYGRKRSALLASLARELGPRCVMRDSRTGLHVMIGLPELPARATPELLESALESQVALYSASPYYLTRPRRCQLLLGFTLPDLEAIERGVQVLRRCLDSLRPAAQPRRPRSAGSPARRAARRGAR